MSYVTPDVTEASVHYGYIVSTGLVINLLFHVFYRHQSTIAQDKRESLVISRDNFC